MNRKAKLEIVQGILLSLLLVLTGVQNYQEYPVISWTIALFGLGLFVYSVFLVRKGSNSQFKVVMISLEGLALVLTSYIYFSEGKKYLPYAILLAAAICFVGAVVLNNRRRKGHSKSIH